MDAPKPLDIGAKSSAWLRQVGVRTHENLAAVGALDAFVRVKRAGFRPSLNLLYALEGTLQGCHWQQVDPARRAELAEQAQAAVARLPPGRHVPPAAEVVTIVGADIAMAGADGQDAPST